MKIFGLKPSDIRKDVLAVLLTVAALAAVVATLVTGFPQVAAAVASVASVSNAIIVVLQKKAPAIDALDNAEL